MIGAFKIRKISNKTMGFWKILLGATYNLCVLLFLTPVFSNETKPLAPQSTNQFLALSIYHPYTTLEKSYKCVKVNRSHKMMLPFAVWWHLLKAVIEKKKKKLFVPKTYKSYTY